MSLRSTFLLAPLILTGALHVARGADNVIAVTVTADHDTAQAPVTVEYTPLQVEPDGVRNSIPAQIQPAAGGAPATLTWIAPAMKKGDKRTFYLTPAKTAAPGTGIEVKRNGENVDFLVNGKLFVRYDTTTGPNKPYFYPVNAPTGKQIVRHWPIEPVATETHDHPHHRGMWFTHSKVNGVDFWMEGKGTGKTVNTGYQTLESGPVYGLMRCTTDWITPTGKKIAEDARDVRVYNISDGYLMDFMVTVKAVGGPLLFGDNKDGMFGLRLADSMRENAGKGNQSEGHIINSNGVKEAATWGKAADWCDYYGPIDGQTVGVAIFDDPHNLRHPTTWHVRDYGLFAANPFGLHDFDSKKNPAGAGDFTVDEGKTITFRYRLFFHNGTTDQAHIPEVWNALAAPPKVEFVYVKDIVTVPAIPATGR